MVSRNCYTLHSPYTYFFIEWEIILKALKTYKDQNGDLRVHTKFVVPEDPTWPRITRGLKLGAKVAAIRSVARYVKDSPERKAQLDDIGNKPSNHTFYRGLVKFPIFGHFRFRMASTR